MNNFTEKEIEIIKRRFVDVIEYKSNIIFMDRKILIMHNDSVLDVDFPNLVECFEDVDMAISRDETIVAIYIPIIDGNAKSEFIQYYEKRLLAIKLESSLPQKPVKQTHKI